MSEPMPQAAAATPADPVATTAPAAVPRPGRRWRVPLLLAGPAVVLAAAAYIYLNSGRYATTDNAYVKADTLAISAAVAGVIERIAVDENQRVKAGDILFEIDDTNYRLARDRAESQLATVRSLLTGLAASYAGVIEELALARTDVSYAERQVTRERTLAEQGLGSESDLDDARHKLDQARQQIPILDQRLAQLEAQLGGDAGATVEHHAAYLAARAALAEAESDLARTLVRAPFAGIVSHVPRAGGYAAPGVPVLSLVATEDFWIEANYKETQLTHVVVGQPVLVRIDTYGKDEWPGRVDSISPATGAEFSVIPAQTASGNWVKVAQRIPVRIRLDAPAGGVTLRAGMSATVEIDTGFEREAPPFLGFLQHSPQPGPPTPSLD
jgi:membrane fusion protein (multidrug efflux system)